MVKDIEDISCDIISQKRREWESNRDVVRRKVGGKGGYCFSCDAAIVQRGQKCPVCKAVMGMVRRNKKDW